ncbi:MAG: PASTA domain-containing protein, partial [Actinomycetota bacterium]
QKPVPTSQPMSPSAPMGMEDYDEADLDEYPEPPPPAGRLRKLLVVALILLAAAGGALAWYISRPEHVKVPALAGMEKDTALNEIAGSFTPDVQSEPSEDVAAGLVIRTDPDAGATAKKNSALTIFVSTGAAPRVLPELAGLTLALAKQKLDAIGLVLIEGDGVYDNKIEKGKVVSWSVPDSPALAAGGTVTKGTKVEVVLSKGPSPLAAPDLTGKSLDEATATLSTAQLLILKGDDVFSATVAPGKVAQQSPSAGGDVQKGGTVTVNLSKGPEMVALPDPAGKDYNGIVNALKTAGFTLGKVNGNTTLAFLGYHVNGAATTAPTAFPKGTVVELFFKAS